MPALLYFASEPREIAGHLWRVVVTDSKFGGRRFLYQFAPIGELPIWQDMREWPAFSFTAPDMGLPASLALLYEANAPALDAALYAGQPTVESVSALLWA